MLDENVIKDLMKLIDVGMITTADIKDLNYRAEVEKRLNI